MKILRTETAAALTAIDPDHQMHPAVRSVLIDALNAAVDAQQPGLSRTAAAKGRKEAAEAAADLVALVLAMGDPESRATARAKAYADSVQAARAAK